MERKYQVFVSSTYNDLKEERKAVSQALLECNCIPAGMELFPASNDSSWKIIKKVIDDSDYYLLIIAGKYGSTLKRNKKQISYTELEFNYAQAQKKPIIAFLHSNINELKAANVETTQTAQRRLQSFCKKVKDGRNVIFWNDISDLVSKVKSSINLEIKNNPTSGWIRCEDIGIANGDSIAFPYNNLVLEWGFERVFKTRAEKNSESDVLLEKHNIKQLDGIAFGLRSFRNTREKDMLMCLQEGMNARLLIMDPESPFAIQRAKEEKVSPKSIADSISDLLNWVKKLNDQSNQGKIQVKLYNSMTLDFYWRIDNILYTGPYWYGIDSQQTITYKMKEGGRGFDLYTNYFDSLWNNMNLCHFPKI